jgi:autotransporter family porin
MLRRLGAITTVIASVATVIVITAGAEAAVDNQSPTRVLDTRIGLGAPVGRVQPNQVLKLFLDDVQQDGETTVLLNLTNDGASQPGHVTAWSCVDQAPATSILNYGPGRSTPNMVSLRYTDAGLCFSAKTPVHLIADLTGVVTNRDINSSRPDRLLDTRTSQPLARGREYRYQVAGTPGIPANAVAAALNVTVVSPRAAGWVLVKPCGSTSNASTINFLANEVVPHFTFSGLSGGTVCVTSSARTDLVIDTFGSLTSSSPLKMLPPSRLLDTRSGLGGTSGSVRNGEVVRVRVAGHGNVPNDAAGATVNVVAVDGSADGFVTVWPCDRARPTTSTLNLWPGVLRSNQATMTLSQSGELCLYTKLVDSGWVDLVVDVVGYTNGSIDRPPPSTTVPPTTVPPTTLPPSGRFATLPVGASLPSGAACAAQVSSEPEIRPENSGPNNVRGNRANANNRNDWSQFDRVDGDFVGTTDEVIQWAACKWGIDEDIARAQVVKESFWYQSANGDNGESWGLGQVRDTAHQSAFEYSVNARTSSAYNLDYTYASWRACFEGVYTWLNTVERGALYKSGDVWGCTGVWFSGRWYTDASIRYIEGGDTGGYGAIGVKEHYQDQTWETASFING